MEVIELQERIKGLKNYINGLKQIICSAEQIIRKSELEIMCVCSHELGTEYVVGTQSSWDPDDGAESFHCEYCGVCNVLFVTGPFGYYGKPKQQDHKTVSLNNDIFAPFTVDRKTMWKDE